VTQQQQQHQQQCSNRRKTSGGKLTEEEPGEKLQWDHSLTRQMKQINRVNDLILWNLQNMSLC